MDILRQNKRAITVEFLGTLILSVLSGVAITWQNYWFRSGGCVNINTRDSMLLFGPFAAVMTWIAYSISGAHFNPIVTIGTLITGKISLVKGVLIFIAQVWGYAIGGAITLGIIPNKVLIQRDFLNNGDRTLPIPKGIGFYTSKNYRDNGFSFALLASEFISGLVLYFGYYMGSSMKNCTSRGMAVIMGLSYMIAISFSSGTTGGLANPILILGHLVWRQGGLGPILFSDDLGWVLLVGPTVAALISALTYPLIFKLTSPFSTKKGNNAQPEHTQNDLQEGLNPGQSE